MWLYLLIFIIPVFFYYHPFHKKERNLYFFASYLFFLAIFVGMSDMLGGYDRYIYGEVFDSIADVTTKYGSYKDSRSFDFFPTEYGYICINIIFSFFTANRYIFILLYTFLIYFFLFVSFKQYAENYPLVLVLFMGLWFFFSFTYLRQVLGATIAWLSIRYIINRKSWKFFGTCFLACLIHKSAIVFFPIYFVPIRKFSKSTILMVMIIFFLIGMSPIPNMFFSLYGDYSVVEMQEGYNSDGTLRIEYLVEAIFFLFILLTRNRYIPSCDSVNVVFLNMAFAFCATLLLFIRSSNGGRLSWYFLIGIIITISTLISRGRKSKEWTKFVIMICLGLYLRIYVSWNDSYYLYPYKSFLTNGHRIEDVIRNRYEYDTGYDQNKMYRSPFRIHINI